MGCWSAFAKTARMASRHFERPEGPQTGSVGVVGGQTGAAGAGPPLVVRRHHGGAARERVPAGLRLTERLIPGELLACRPTAEERQRFTSPRDALRALGVATPRWMADYFRDWARPHSTAEGESPPG